MSWSGRLIDYLGQGTAASLPSAPTLAPGAAAFYFAYDTVAMYAWNGNTSAWDLVTATGMSNPMTTAGDMIVGGSSGTPTRFAAPTTGSTWYLSYVVGTGFAWGTIAGSGDMLAATYDPAGIAQQVVGTTATQALTNKDLSDASNTFPVALSKIIASGTAALGTSAIASGAKATTVTVTAAGVASTDALIWGFNSDPTSTTGYVPSTSGMLTIIAYPSSGNVNFVVCNNTGASITPGAVTLNWRVVR